MDMMGLWKKKVDTAVTIPARIARLDGAGLLNWFATTEMELGATFDKYRFHKGEFSDVKELLEILNAIATEIQNRNERN
jgi:hypothetical protein